VRWGVIVPGVLERAELERKARKPRKNKWHEVAHELQIGIGRLNPETEPYTRRRKKKASWKEERGMGNADDRTAS